jgi:hypothetical protein
MSKFIPIIVGVATFCIALLRGGKREAKRESTGTQKAGEKRSGKPVRKGRKK